MDERTHTSATIHWDLTLQLALWNFGSPSGLPLPKWELPWECECSLPHTPLHFLKLPGVCGDSRASSWPTPFQCLCFRSQVSFLLAYNLATPCLGREPKARVATIALFISWIIFWCSHVQGLLSQVHYVPLFLAHLLSKVQTIFKKTLDSLVYSHVFKGMGNIIYLWGVSSRPLSQAIAKKETLIQLSNLSTMYPSTKS